MYKLFYILLLKCKNLKTNLPMVAIQNDYCKTAYCKIRPRLKVIFDIASGKFILYKIVCFFLKINNILIKDVFLSIIYKQKCVLNR